MFPNILPVNELFNMFLHKAYSKGKCHSASVLRQKSVVALPYHMHDPLLFLSLLQYFHCNIYVFCGERGMTVCVAVQMYESVMRHCTQIFSE